MEFPLFLILTALFLSLFPKGIKPMVHSISVANKSPLAINSPRIVQKDIEGNLHSLNGALAFQKKEKSHSIHLMAKNDENHSMRILALQKAAINDQFTNFAEQETNEKINKIERGIGGESKIEMGNLFFNGIGYTGGHHKNDELVDEKECPFETDKPLVVICGATGTGKSDLAIEIAKTIGNGKGEVISADSMQIYKGLDIATNKVTVREMAGIPHHLMSFLEPYVPNYDKWRFRNDAIKIIEQIWEKGGIPIVAGGSVPYIESLIYCKEKPKELKNKIDLQHLFSKFPTNKALYERLVKIDPETAKEILPDNSARVIRELESFYSGEMKTETQILREKKAAEKAEGKKITKIPMRYKNTLLIYLDMEMKKAHQINLDKRVDKMLVRGLWDELKEYYEKYKIYIGNNYQGWFGGMQTIGLNAFLPYLEMDEAERESEKGREMFENCKKEFQKGDNKYAKLQRRNFYENILRPNEHREMPNVVGLNMSNNFHYKIVPFARELVKTFLDGQNFEEILEKKPGLVMKIVKPEEEKK